MFVTNGQIECSDAIYQVFWHGKSVVGGRHHALGVVDFLGPVPLPSCSECHQPFFVALSLLRLSPVRLQPQNPWIVHAMTFANSHPVDDPSLNFGLVVTSSCLGLWILPMSSAVVSRYASTSRAVIMTVHSSHAGHAVSAFCCNLEATWSLIMDRTHLACCRQLALSYTS